MIYIQVVIGIKNLKGEMFNIIFCINDIELKYLIIFNKI